MNANRAAVFRPTLLAAALASLAASPCAHALDVIPAAVAQAYAGAATPEKLAAALAGLKQLTAELPLISAPVPGWSSGYTGYAGGSVNSGFFSEVGNPGYLGFAFIMNDWDVAGDSDLATLGNPVRLANARLFLNASFTTARDFIIGDPGQAPDYISYSLPTAYLPGTEPSLASSAGPGYIDTNGFDLTITGTVTSHQTLWKQGEGTLWLTGNNVWNAAPVVTGGVLKGNAGSLDGAIHISRGMVEFNQAADGTYRHTLDGQGALRKTGAGTLTLTAEQAHTGGTTISEGVLALAQSGKLPGQGRLRIETGGSLDLTAVGANPVLSSLEGTGRVVLGANGLTLHIGYEDTSFGGTLTGDGPLTVKGAGLALTGVNSFTGGLRVQDTLLGVGQAASLGAGPVRLDGGTLRLLAPMRATQGLSIDTTGILDSHGNDAEWAGAIAGSGRLVKDGLGSLALTGNNTLSGELRIAQGSVKLAGAGHVDNVWRVTVDGTLDLTQTDAARRVRRLEGTGTVLLGASGMVLDTQSADASFSGAIIGAGGITKVGQGSQFLLGANDYAGTTTIQEGVLRVTAQSLGQHVVNHATLDFIQGGGADAIAAWSGDIEGDGQVWKTGNGALWLRGHNTHTGGTHVLQGSLIGNTDSLTGDIENQAFLAFYQTADGSYAGRIYGNGALMSYGPGALTLTGENNYSGGTAFSNTLRIYRDSNIGVPGSGLLIAGGTLQAMDYLTLNRHVALGEAGARFDSNGFGIVLNGRIDGPGGVTKLGEGVLYLAGEHGYAGPTRIEQGGMVVNGSFLGDVEVMDGAWFHAKGRVGGDLSVASGATFSAGNSPGLLVVDGDFLAQGEILVEIAGSDLHDFIQVGGSADLAGATLRFVLLGGAAPGDLAGLSFLSAAGGITGLDRVSYAFGPGLEGYRVATNGGELFLAPVPEPETWTMLLAGLGLIGVSARHKARA